MVLLDKLLDKLGVSPSGVNCLYWMELYLWRIEAYGGTPPIF